MQEHYPNMEKWWKRRIRTLLYTCGICSRCKVLSLSFFPPLFCSRAEFLRIFIPALFLYFFQVCRYLNEVLRSFFVPVIAKDAQVIMAVKGEHVRVTWGCTCWMRWCYLGIFGLDNQCLSYPKEELDTWPLQNCMILLLDNMQANKVNACPDTGKWHKHRHSFSPSNIEKLFNRLHVHCTVS